MSKPSKALESAARAACKLTREPAIGMVWEEPTHQKRQFALASACILAFLEAAEKEPNLLLQNTVALRRLAGGES